MAFDQSGDHQSAAFNVLSRLSQDELRLHTYDFARTAAI
jgi:hypothetical protein